MVLVMVMLWYGQVNEGLVMVMVMVRYEVRCGSRG